MENVDLAQWISTIVAVVAAVIAVFAAMQSKRNADKVLGDIEPFIHVFQDPLTGLDGDIPRLVVQIINHNRRPMHLDLTFASNDGFRVYFADKDPVRHIVNTVLAESSEREVRYRMMIDGNYALSTPPVNNLRFAVHRNDDVLPSETTVGITAEFQLDDGPRQSVVRTASIVRRNDKGGDDFTHLSIAEPKE